MYKEMRLPTDSTGMVASTPDDWARNFSTCRAGLSPLRKIVLSIDERYKLIKKYMPPNGKILDAGCGVGDWVSFLAEKGYRACGLDYSETLISRLKKACPDLEWVHGDTDALPFENESLDGIVSWGVIEHCEDGPEKALKEFYRALKPGGITIVTVPNDSKWSRAAAAVPDNTGNSEIQPKLNFFQYLMTPGELVAHCESVGFETLDSKPTGGASLALLSPKAYVRLRRTRLFRPANAAIKLTMSWSLSLHNMVYAVARKPVSAQ